MGGWIRPCEISEGGHANVREGNAASDRRRSTDFSQPAHNEGAKHERHLGIPADHGLHHGTNLTGYKVEATDGSIGKVDKHSDEVGSSCIVVDTGVWIFGKHVLLPAGTITLIDASEKKIHVSRTKAEIKESPEFDKDKHLGDPGYHEAVGEYYDAPRV